MGLRSLGSLGPGLVAVVMVLLVPLTVTAEVAVIPIGYADGDRILSITRPLLSPGGSASYDSHSGSLIVADTPERIQRIRSIVAAVDRPPVQLMIRVRFESNRDMRRHGGRIEGRVSGEKWRAGTGGRNSDGVDVTVEARHRQRAAVSEQRLRLVSGTTGTIMTGKEIPIDGAWISRCRSAGGCRGTVRYHRVETGFDITPEARADSVRIRLAPRIAAVEDRNWVVGFSRASVEMAVPYQEWVDIGGIAGAANETSAAVLRHAHENKEQRLQMLIWVERIN